jgi:hypothetical protein
MDGGRDQGRGIDLLTPVYNMLDLTPQGRDGSECQLRDLSGQYLRDEARCRFADCIWRVFLKEVRALHRDGLLVRPGSAELALCTNQESPRLRIDE